IYQGDGVLFRDRQDPPCPAIEKVLFVYRNRLLERSVSKIVVCKTHRLMIEYGYVVVAVYIFEEGLPGGSSVNRHGQCEKLAVAFLLCIVEQKAFNVSDG